MSKLMTRSFVLLVLVLFFSIVISDNFSFQLADVKRIANFRDIELIDAKVLSQPAQANVVEFRVDGDLFIIDIDEAHSKYWQVKVNFNGACPRVEGIMHKVESSFVLKLSQKTSVIIRIEKIVFSIMPYGNIEFLILLSLLVILLFQLSF